MEDRFWEDGAVSVFRPSYSATSLNCAGSLIPSMTARDTAGYEAAEGTVFHELIAHWQQHGRPDSWLGEKRQIVNGDQAFEVIVNDDMFTFAEQCLDRYRDTPGDRFVETRVDISSLTPIPDQGGTCDLAICSYGLLDITDWKYGTGVQVYAYQNTQLLLYAWGFFSEYGYTYDFQRIILRIAQPRLNHWDAWEISREELVEFARWARERWALAWIPGAPRSPSPKACQWCKVRLPCPALEVYRQALADLAFDVLDQPVSQTEQQKVASLAEPTSLSTEDLARIYRYRKLMENWFSDIADELINRGLNGEDLGVWKVVEGRLGNRHWVDEQRVIAGLTKIGIPEDDLYQRKLFSPNQAEKLVRAAGVPTALSKQYVNLFTYRAPGKPALVPSSDARLDATSIVDETFNEDP